MRHMKRIMALVVFALFCSAATASFAESLGNWSSSAIDFGYERDMSGATCPTNFALVTIQQDSYGTVTGVNEQMPILPGVLFPLVCGPRAQGLYLQAKVGVDGKYVKVDDKTHQPNAEVEYEGPGECAASKGVWMPDANRPDGRFRILISLGDILAGGMEEIRLKVTFVSGKERGQVRFLIFRLTYSSKDLQETDKLGYLIPVVAYEGPRTWVGLQCYMSDYQQYVQMHGGMLYPTEGIYSLLRKEVLAGYLTQDAARQKFPSAFRNLDSPNDNWDSTPMGLDQFLRQTPSLPMAAPPPTASSTPAQTPLSRQELDAKLFGASPQQDWSASVREIAVNGVTHRGVWFRAAVPIKVIRREGSHLDTVFIPSGMADTDGQVIGNANGATFTLYEDGKSPVQLDNDGKPSGE